MAVLYKFVARKEAVKAIVGGSLKFTKIDELNDPSELVPIMNRDAVQASLVAIRRAKYSKEQFEWLGCQEAILRLLSPETRILSRPPTVELANQTLVLPIYDDLDFMENQVLQTIRLIRSRVGVLSLTERFDSLPMWAHYGAQAKGYALRFEGLEKEFAGDETGSLNAVKSVRYVEDLIGLTHDPSTQDNLFFCKFKDWSYEREWRVVSALSACHLSKDSGMYLRSVDPSRVTGIIFGWNISKTEIDLLVSEIKQINAGIQICFASLSKGRVVLGA